MAKLRGGLSCGRGRGRRQVLAAGARGARWGEGVGGGAGRRIEEPTTRCTFGSNWAEVYGSGPVRNGDGREGGRATRWRG